MGQWYEQPEEEEPRLFSAKPARSTWLVFSIALAIVAAFALVLLLCACKSPPARTGEFRASLRIEFSNGQEITSGNASSDDSGTSGHNSCAKGSDSRGNEPDSQNVVRNEHGDR